MPTLLRKILRKAAERGAQERTEQSFLMDKEKITQNDYDPSINKYKKVEYPSTMEIMEDLQKLEVTNKALMQEYFD